MRTFFQTLAGGCLLVLTLAGSATAQTRLTLWDPTTNSRAEALVARDFLRIDRGISIDTYTRDRQFDGVGYLGFSNGRLGANQIVRWPSDNRGAIEIGSLRFGRPVFRPARMRIVGGGGGWNGGNRPGGWRPTTYLGVRLTFHPLGGGIVTAVDRGSLAEDIGVRVGDHLLEINGRPFADNNGFRDALARSQRNIELRLRRAGRTLDLRASLRGRSTPWARQPAPPIFRPPTELGVVGFGDVVNGGVTVQSVRRGSVAELMGVLPGDRIERVNRIRVATTNDFRVALARSRTGVEVDLMRFGRGLTLRFP